MFNIIVNKEYELLFENLKAEAPESFSLTLADFSKPDQILNELLQKADAIIGQVNLSDVQYKTAKNLQIIQTLSAGFDRIDVEKAKRHNVLVANNNGANAISVAEHVLMLISSRNPTCSPASSRGSSESSRTYFLNVSLVSLLY